MKTVSVMEDNNVNIFELSYDELQDYNNQKYDEFKKLRSTTNLPVDEIFHQLNINKGDPTYRYINNQNRINENNTNPKCSYNAKTKLKINKTPEEAYTEYKDLFYNSDLSIRDIYDKIGVPQNQNTHYTYIREQAEKDGLNGYSRRLLLKKGGRPKGSKNLKSLTGTEKENHDNEFEEKYQEFLDYFQDLSLSVQDILKKMGTHHKSNLYFYIRRRLKQDGIDIKERQGKVIGAKIKKTYAERRKDNTPYFEEKFQEYKRLFNESKLFVGQIYNELEVEPRSSCAKYIRKRAEEEGLNARKRRCELHPLRKTSEEEQKIREELYSEYKKLFLETDIPINEIYKEIGIGYQSKRGVYIRDKAHQEGLNANHRFNTLKTNDKIYEELYDEYKRLFNTTEYKIGDIYKQLNVKHGTYEHKYIRERANEEGLDGRQRMFKIRERKVAIRGGYKPNSSKGKSRNRKYSNTIIKQIEDSSETLNRVFKQRNIGTTTQKGYISCMYHWFNFLGDKFNNLQENIDFYFAEEDERVPMRERTIKKDLLGFREYLINCESMNTQKSIMSYYSKITAIFRHVSLEIPTLPKVKLEKGYVSNYNDLPTHEMIRTACDQSPDVLKSILLFMSSSGSAKAETLSITIKMFLEGCSEYLTETPTSKNIKKCLNELKDRHDIIPLIYLRRIKTDKWYYTCCSPEASYMIIKYLNECPDLKWEDKLFPFTSSLLLSRFQKINDGNNWGKVGGYRRFRAHTLRKFMASNIGLPRDQVDSFQGRSKDMIAEAYFKQDPKQLKKIYISAMSNVMIYNNWDYEITESSTTQSNNIIEKTPVTTMEMVHNEPEPIEEKNSIADELLKYAELMNQGLITKDEFSKIKTKLLGGII